MTESFKFIHTRGNINTWKWRLRSSIQKRRTADRPVVDRLVRLVVATCYVTVSSVKTTFLINRTPTPAADFLGHFSCMKSEIFFSFLTNNNIISC